VDIVSGDLALEVSSMLIVLQHFGVVTLDEADELALRASYAVVVIAKASDTRDRTLYLRARGVLRDAHKHVAQAYTILDGAPIRVWIAQPTDEELRKAGKGLLEQHRSEIQNKVVDGNRVACTLVREATGGDCKRCPCLHGCLLPDGVRTRSETAS
jgi:hypothetical protein